MKTTIRYLAIVIAVLTAQTAPAPVGYVLTVFHPGSYLFNNALDNGAGNSLNNLFSYQIPNGTTVSLWNATTLSFDTTSTYSSGLWSINLTLQPGTGVLINTPSTFTNVAVGDVLNHDGSYFSSSSTFTPPPIFSGPDGIYLLGDKCPTRDTGTDIFLNILGRLPNVGEQATLLNNISQTYTTSTYLGDGSWDIVPVLKVGDAAFLKIESVPEPGVLILFGLCMLLSCWHVKVNESGIK